MERRYAYLRALVECQTDSVSGIDGQTVSIQGATNATSLTTTGSPVVINNDVPNASEVLTATGATSAEWQNYTPIAGTITMPTNAGAVPGNYPQNNRMTINEQGLISDVNPISEGWLSQAITQITTFNSFVGTARSKRIGDVGYVQLRFTSVDLASPLNTITIELPSLPLPVNGPYYGAGCFRNLGLAFSGALGFFSEVELDGQTINITSSGTIPAGTAMSFSGQVVYLTTEP